MTVSIASRHGDARVTHLTCSTRDTHSTCCFCHTSIPIVSTDRIAWCCDTLDSYHTTDGSVFTSTGFWSWWSRSFTFTRSDESRSISLHHTAIAIGLRCGHHLDTCHTCWAGGHRRLSTYWIILHGTSHLSTMGSYRDEKKK